MIQKLKMTCIIFKGWSSIAESAIELEQQISKLKKHQQQLSIIFLAPGVSYTM